ncbi:hypothetical protein MKQ70_25095 [Chitinophaga sedimenti]|uniref:hypothetical protein n=1 Tax=Chitinophaga sedimenti TaxID=2033606 RepID=UPI0020046C00|nr:hypothetical protein [Chitinophaga sedimenti]MCK7558104.1 hypothetical protein [Chitinophaga sedimenti]
MKAVLRYDSSVVSNDKNNWLYRKLFYEHLIEIKQPDFNVFMDLHADLNVGRTNAGGGKNTWLNTRGASIQGNIGKQLYFESYFFENQGAFPVYLDTFIRKHRVVPGQGEIRDFSGGKAFDYAYVSAMLSYTPSKFLNMTMGYGSNSIGDGYRSLILSDVPFSYPYLKATLNLGNVQYTSMWAQFRGPEEFRVQRSGSRCWLLQEVGCIPLPRLEHQQKNNCRPF